MIGRLGARYRDAARRAEEAAAEAAEIRKELEELEARKRDMLNREEASLQELEIAQSMSGGVVEEARFDDLSVDLRTFDYSRALGDVEWGSLLTGDIFGPSVADDTVEASAGQ